MLMAERCAEYTAVVWEWSADYPLLDPALVLAVAAKESNCVADVTDSYSPSTGFMQINPQGLGVDPKSLRDVRNNVRWGMKILTGTIYHDEKNPTSDVRRGLAAYNCGWESLDAGRCYDFGGYAYADSVLEEWVPPMRLALIEYARLPHPVLSHWNIADDVLEWLASWGYAPELTPVLQSEQPQGG